MAFEVRRVVTGVDGAGRAVIRSDGPPPVLVEAPTGLAVGELLWLDGAPDGSLNASSETGRWVAAMSAVCLAGRSAAKASRMLAGLMDNSVAVPPPATGYWAASRAGLSTLSFEPASTAPSVSPWSGAKAAT